MADPGPSYSCTSHKLNVSKDIGWTENSVDSPFLYQFLRPERAIRAGSGRITPLPYTYLYPRGFTRPDTPFTGVFSQNSDYSKYRMFPDLENCCRLCVRRIVPLNRMPSIARTHPRVLLPTAVGPISSRQFELVLTGWRDREI